MGMFIAVKVAGGRLFKGDAYRVDGEYVSRFGWSGSGVAPLRIVEKVKVWDPISGETSYVNDKYVVDREVSPEQYEADLAKYGDGILVSTMEWCRSRSAGKDETEVVKFAYNVVRKNHPELLAQFETKYGFKDDVAEVVQSTIDWALKLGYRSDKAVRIAHRALCKKGLTVKDSFASAWTMNLDLRGLGKYAAPYVAA